MLENKPKIKKQEIKEDDEDEWTKAKREEKEKAMKWMIRGDGSFRFWWDIAIIVCMTYSVWKIPIKMAYAPPIMNGEAMALIDSLIDFFYLMDVLVSFRTTYMDLLEGAQVTDSYKIATRYLKGDFFIDFISSIPIDTITGVPLLNSVGLLKAFRYRKLGEIIRTANVNAAYKVNLKLAFIIY